MRIRARDRQEAICGSMKAGRAVARAPWKQRQPSQGSGEHSCGFAGAGVCNRLSFAALLGSPWLSRLSYATPSGVFRPRVCSHHPTAAWPPSVPRDVSPAASWLISIGETKGHQPSSQLGRVLSWVSKDYVEGALPHGGAPIVEPLAELHHSFLAPKNAVAAHRFLQIRSVPDDPAQGSNQP